MSYVRRRIVALASITLVASSLAIGIDRVQPSSAHGRASTPPTSRTHATQADVTDTTLTTASPRLTQTPDRSRVMADAHSWTACLNDNGVTYQPVTAGGEQAVHGNGPATIGRCGYLAVAGAAAGHLETAALEARFLAIGGQPARFWPCLANHGWELPIVPGGGRQDFQSPDFLTDANACAARTGARITALAAPR